MPWLSWRARSPPCGSPAIPKPGAGIRDDFTTETPGALDTQKITVVAADIGNLDGVTRMGPSIIVNDWITGAVFAVSDDGEVSKVAQHKPGLADISSDENTLYLPMMLNGTLLAVSYP